MKFAPLLASATLAVAALGFAGSAQAVILDLSAMSDVGQTYVFTPGDYTFGFVDNTAGSGFNGWSFWSSNSNCDAITGICDAGFSEHFSVDILGGDSYLVIKDDPGAFNGYPLYATPELALASYQSGGLSYATNAGPRVEFGSLQSIVFHVATTTTAHFYLQDGNYGDNRGGVSLSITAVPEPATWGLMILGFGGIGALLRRRRDQAAFVAG